MPALFSISQDNSKSEEIADFLLFLMNEDRITVPKLTLPQILMSKSRQGLSAENIASRIISRFPEAGLPQGPLKDGTANSLEQFVKLICEEVVDAIQNDMRVDIAVDSGIIGQGSGANAGGPITTINTTIKPHTGVGVAR
jgi:hypothetical protein